MSSRFFSFIMILFFAAAVNAQSNPVDWSYEAKKINTEEYQLIFTADIESGWDVYSQFLADGGPIPTSFTFTGTEGIQMLGKTEESGKDKKEAFDDLFEMKLIKYGKKATFTQKIKVTPAAKTVKGYLTFMTCNDESCLPPKDVDFEISLK